MQQLFLVHPHMYFLETEAHGAVLPGGLGRVAAQRERPQMSAELLGGTVPHTLVSRKYVWDWTWKDCGMSRCSCLHS